MVRDGLFDKMTFEQKPEVRDQDLVLGNLGIRMLQADGRAGAKALLFGKSA